MPLRSEKVVINGELVTRFNGNNCKGSNARGSEEPGKKVVRKQRAAVNVKRQKAAKGREKAQQASLWSLDGT